MSAVEKRAPGIVADAHAILDLPRWEIVRGRNSAEVMRLVERGRKAGEYGEAMSNIVRVPSGQYTGWRAAKVLRVAEPAAPPPAWLRPLQWVGGILAGLGVVCTGLAMAVGALLDAAGRAVGALPLGEILFAAVLGGVALLLLTGGGRRMCRTIVEHWH